MNQMTHNLDLQFNAEPLPAAHEGIPTPFVRTPSEPNCLRVALAGAGTRRESSMTRTLRARGHGVTVYASAGALLYQLRNHPPSLDVIVLDCGRETDAVVPSLELLRAHDDALAIVLIFDGDPSVLAAARRLSVEQVLERPVHSVALHAALAASSLPCTAV